MALQDEIDFKAKQIHSDSYSMSIGELSSIYKDGEIDIHPDFQRIYRWTDYQKTKLIESILLGIPIPSIFVAQREDGVWDVIDGLQRLSTIFEFMGILKNENDELYSPLKLQSTKYLPSLCGKFWESSVEEDSLNITQRLIIKRAKIDIQIVKRESDQDAKYELFQRLNTGGSKLSEQEVRNCLLVMIDKDRFRWLKRLTDYEAFQACLTITDRSKNEAYDNELVLRYMIYRNESSETITRSTDLSDLITSKMLEYVENESFDFKKEEETFKKTFTILNSCLAEDTFRKFDQTQEKFRGPFSISAYETIIRGLSLSIESYSENDYDEIISKIKGLWTDENFISHSGAGLRASDRIKYLFPLGERLFSK